MNELILSQPIDIVKKSDLFATISSTTGPSSQRISDKQGHTLNVVGLREQIEGLDFNQPIPRIDEYSRIAGQAGRVAGYVDQPLWTKRNETPNYVRGQAAARWVGYDGVNGFIESSQDSHHLVCDNPDII